jgi:hypothetical protein
MPLHAATGALWVLFLAAPVLAEDALLRAARVVREHGLLSQKQMRCMTLVLREDSTRAVTKVGVYERHDKRCGGDPAVTHRLFDLEIDAATGAARWDKNFPDMEMRPVPKRR